MDVVCPDSATAGDTIAVTTDTGASFNVVVPAGVGPGVTFQLELPAETPAASPPARPTFEAKQDPREAEALLRLQRFARRRHRRLQARRGQLAQLRLPDDERARPPLLVPPTPAKNLLKRQERAALVIQSYARARAVRRQAAELAAVSGVVVAAPKISINEESAAGWRAWLERAGRPDNAGDENGLPDDPFEPLRLQLALRLPHGGAALSAGGMVLGGFMEAVGDELCALLGLGREQLRVTRVTRGDPAVLHFELHAGVLRAAAVGVSPAQAALTLAQIVAGEAPGKRPPHAPPAVSPLAYTEWLCHADAAVGLRRSLADGAVVRVGHAAAAAAAVPRLSASASSASSYHGRMARLSSAGTASAAGLTTSGASARSLSSTAVGARGAAARVGAGGRGAARRGTGGAARRAFGGAGGGGGGGGVASRDELGVMDAALAWAAAGSEKARPMSERLVVGGVAPGGLPSRSLALREAVRRSAPSAPSWLLEAIERMELGGGFEVDGEESGWRAARLPAPVWSLLPLGACGALHRLRLAGVGLAAMPDDVARLSELQQLLLPGNALTAVPRLSSLPRLTSLDLSRNHLAALPEHVGGLLALRRLSVAHNQLAALPDALCGLERLERLDASHNQLEVLPPHMGDAPRGLARLASLDLSANRLQALPACLLRLEHCALRSLHLERNPLPPAAMLFRARLRSGVYVAVEFCIAPRPSFSLKGDSTRYLRAFLEVRAAVHAVLGARVPVVPNPGAAETRQEVGELDDALEAAHYPRLGACEVVARSQLGAFNTLHSKVATARFAQPAAVVASLLRHLGLPVHPEGYAEGDAEVARAELRAAAAAGDVPRVYAALAHSPHVAGPDAVRAAREAGHEAVVRMLAAAGAAG